MATSNLYFTVGTTKKWKSSGGDAVITFTSVANGAGRSGARLDLGDLMASTPAARQAWYRWYVLTKSGATATLNSTFDLYFGGWNDDVTPGNPSAGGFLTSADAAFATAAALGNLLLAGSVVVDATASGSTYSKSGLIFLPFRYVSPVLWNASGAAASATATDHEIWLTPFAAQAQ